MMGNSVIAFSRTEVVLSAMTGNSGNACQQDRNSVVCYDGNSINCYDRSRVTFMTGIARKHIVHMKKAAAIRNILLYKADSICKYLLYTEFPIATAPIRLIGLSIICL